MSGPKILVVDDENKIVAIVKAYLEREGYQVLTADNGRAALEIARKQSPALMVLDLMLPEMSGWDVCRALRKESNMPVIMLTAREEADDRILGLELGADDYITKPFNPKEVVSRVRAVLRRTSSVPDESKVINIGELSIDIDRRLVKRGSRTIDLTSVEFDILRVLAEKPGRVYARMQLLDKVQGEAYEAYERTIDSHIKNLRKKIEPDSRKPRYILTIYGVGYKLAEDAHA